MFYKRHIKFLQTLTNKPTCIWIKKKTWASFSGWKALQCEHLAADFRAVKVNLDDPCRVIKGFLYPRSHKFNSLHLSVLNIPVLSNSKETELFYSLHAPTGQSYHNWISQYSLYYLEKWSTIWQMFLMFYDYPFNHESQTQRNKDLTHIMRAD